VLLGWAPAVAPLQPARQQATNPAQAIHATSNCPLIPPAASLAATPPPATCATSLALRASEEAPCYGASG